LSCPAAHQVEFVFPDRFRQNDLAIGTAKTERVDGTLDDAGSALHAAYCAWHRFDVMIMVDLETVARADVLTDTTRDAFLLIQ
jgi:hypothetical protein